MNDLISVIVPVYRVEAYLDECVSSIVSQTYKNLEIILVDDGSPDNCPAMCDAWAKRDGRIKVIHKRNGGAASARNIGVCAATGDIISFIDSDDVIHERMFDVLLVAMKETGCEIAQCEISYFADKIVAVYDDDKPQYKIYTATEALSLIISDNVIRQTPPNKLYKREVISTTKWPDGKTHEDEFWTYQVVGQSRTICCVNAPMYFYRQHTQSAVHKPFSIKSLDCMDAIRDRYVYISKHYPELTSAAYRSLFGSILYSCQCALTLQDATERKLCMKRIADCYRFFRRQHVKLYSTKDKIWLSLSRISLHLTGCIRNILQIGV